MGTIIPRLTANFTSTSEAGKYLYCDGSTFDTAKYPKLYAILGINQLPDLRNRFLQGDDIGGTVIEAGLPNITAQWAVKSEHNGFTHILNNAAYFYDTQRQEQWAVNYSTYVNYPRLGFDASRSNTIYGKSNTVQPPAVTVRYYIRAK